MDNKKLMKEMLEFRALNGLSQEQAARAADISLQTWNSVENGRQAPSKVTIAKIVILMRGGVRNED